MARAPSRTTSERSLPNTETAATWAVIGAYQLVSHGLVTTHELEVFLEALRAQLAALEEQTASD